ncbi:MAG TPA: inosine/xanthosine triphosphatase [Pyrinomonadaceae bacterium]|nr:inosine/xanthosine triphosphatase [Pyrinomonadaceae bacterium]
MKIALGTTRASKIDAVRAAAMRIAEIDSGWRGAEIIPMAVETDSPAMPLTDEELMLGAKSRAEAVRKLLQQENKTAQLYIGLEGGFHTVELENQTYTFLRGWAYVTDGTRRNFGASPSISVPASIVKRVTEENRELGDVIDEVARESDIRSRQGAWGVFSRNLLTRSMSFETALIAAFAPFYNEKLYHQI